MAEAEDPMHHDRLRCYAATLDADWVGHPDAAGDEARLPWRSVAALQPGQPIVSAAGFEIGLLDGVVVDRSFVTHLVVRAGHRFGDRDLILPIARVRFDARPLRVVLSRAAIADLPPAAIHWSAPPALLIDDIEQRRRVVRPSRTGTHRRTAIPRRSVTDRPALVAV